MSHLPADPAPSTPPPQPEIKPAIQPSLQPESPSRRSFLGKLGGVAATALTVGGITVLEPALAGKASEARANDIGPLSDAARQQAAATLRTNLANNWGAQSLISHPANGDETLYADLGASYSKCLPHDNYGRVNLSAYSDYINALTTGSPSAFQSIPLGGGRKLTNPQAGLAYTLEGNDGHNCSITQNNVLRPVNPAPVMAGKQTAAELVEMYWAAHLRDVPFNSYASNAVANQAAAELNGLSGYAGPRNSSGLVTTNELFRGSFPGEVVGPYISQFLLLPTFLGTQPLGQRFQTFLPTSAHLLNDFMIDFADWLSIQNGYQPSNVVAVDPTYRYIRNGRDLSAWTHVDVLYQAYFTAFLVLQTIACPQNPGLYSSPTEAGFGTLGGPDIASTIGDVAQKALEAVWFQKWFVHRRARPEVPGALAHLILTGQGADTDVTLDSDLLNSQAITRMHRDYGSYLLPQAFPEGSPTHPSYPTGHGTVGGACITMLKFFFNTNFVIPNPVVTNHAGTVLSPYTGSPLTVQGELNKLGHNITFGHGIHPCIHYRSDSDESLLLGEAVALSILQDKAATYNEPFSVTITKFDGTTVTISNP